MNRVQSAPPPELVTCGLVGQSPAIQAVWHWFGVARRCPDPLLILGETGTGKRRLAQLLAELDHATTEVEEIHAPSLSHADQAHRWQEWVRRIGEVSRSPDAGAARFALVLHEIHECAASLQYQVAGWLSSRTQFVGSSAPRLPVRVIAVSSSNLVDAVAQGTFSKELYWRLNVLPIVLPPLRRRPEDLPLIIEWIGERWRAAHEPTISGVDAAALKAMRHYSWPGNLHELVSCLRATALMGGDRILTADDLPTAIRDQGATAAVTAALGGASPESLAREYVQHSLGQSDTDSRELFQAIVQPIERQLIAQVLQSCDQKQVRAAERLGISRNTLHKKIKEFGLTATD
ncbi:MAG TPA: sigma 54-interacting transcriptional regulator [Pirellulaceae bacterium]|nr:sigma 54-interacting transcriptional regulator [Pirellulaceae bacterium]